MQLQSQYLPSEPDQDSDQVEPEKDVKQSLKQLHLALQKEIRKRNEL